MLQWQHVYTKICTLPFLLKRLRTLGWSKSMLANAYRSYDLSHFDYSAVVLMSCTASDKLEMSRFHKRCLDTISIETTTAHMYNIPSIHD